MIESFRISRGSSEEGEKSRIYREGRYLFISLIDSFDVLLRYLQYFVKRMTMMDMEVE